MQVEGCEQESWFHALGTRLLGMDNPTATCCPFNSLLQAILCTESSKTIDNNNKLLLNLPQNPPAETTYLESFSFCEQFALMAGPPLDIKIMNDPMDIVETMRNLIPEFYNSMIIRYKKKGRKQNTKQNFCVQFHVTKFISTQQFLDYHFKDVRFIQLPKVLFVKADRTNPNDHASKLDSEITIEEVVRIEKKNYQLAAVLVHIGDTINGGHYYTFGRRNNQFYCFNDRNVRAAQPGDIDLIQKNVSYFIYERTPKRKNMNPGQLLQFKPLNNPLLSSKHKYRIPPSIRIDEPEEDHVIDSYVTVKQDTDLPKTFFDLQEFKTIHPEIINPACETEAILWIDPFGIEMLSPPHQSPSKEAKEEYQIFAKFVSKAVRCITGIKALRSIDNGELNAQSLHEKIHDTDIIDEQIIEGGFRWDEIYKQYTKCSSMSINRLRQIIMDVFDVEDVDVSNEEEKKYGLTPETYDPLVRYPELNYENTIDEIIEQYLNTKFPDPYKSNHSSISSPNLSTGNEDYSSDSEEESDDQLQIDNDSNTQSTFHSQSSSNSSQSTYNDNSIQSPLRGDESSPDSPQKPETKKRKMSQEEYDFFKRQLYGIWLTHVGNQGHVEEEPKHCNLSKLLSQWSKAHSKSQLPSLSAAKTWLHEFKTYGEPVFHERGGSKAKFRVTRDQLKAIIVSIIDFPQWNAENRHTMLKHLFGDDAISSRHINRVMSNMNFTIKKPSFSPIVRNTYGLRTFRIFWAKKVKEFESYGIHFCYCDESAVYLTPKRGKSRSWAGLTFLETMPIPKQHLHLISCVIPGVGVIWTFQIEPYKTDQYTAFIREAFTIIRSFVWSSETKFIMIHDNCKIHLKDEINTIASQYDSTMLFTTPYSPQLNAVVEMFFGFGKEVIFNHGQYYHSYAQIINDFKQNTCEKYTPEIQGHYYESWLRQLDLCIEGRPLTCMQRRGTQHVSLEHLRRGTIKRKKTEENEDTNTQ